TLDVSIEPGTSVRQMAQLLVKEGVETDPDWLWLWFRLSGQSRQLKAGNYELQRGITPYDLLNKIASGDEDLRRLALIEGWTFKQFREALNKASDLKHLSADLSDEEVMNQLGRPGLTPEGRFYPDTYAYGKSSTDLALLARAIKAMDQRMAKAWAMRHQPSVLTSPEEMLIMASIIEKETGRREDRQRVSAVFHNRLAIDMPLQTDPTVIYGLFDQYQGRLRRADLTQDHAWNTYTRKGLPPTPIAMPGWASLVAAVQPAQTKDLYFVARGDGSSEFSQTLQEHNQAVDTYIRRKFKATEHRRDSRAGSAP
ncbi:MAG: hypothetical protein RL307_1317, partial [Pseudomonadota bacterium]